MNKDTFLDIEELVSQNKEQENIRLNIFNGVLQQIHSLIRRKNKQRIRCMNFKLPLIIAGKPAYDINVMRNYVLHHLEDNGFLVKLHSDNLTVFISWDEADINFEKFKRKKQQLSQEFKDVYLQENGGGGNDNFERVGMQMMQERHRIQKQIKEERNKRLNKDSRFGNIPISYEEFLQKY